MLTLYMCIVIVILLILNPVNKCKLSVNKCKDKILSYNKFTMKIDFKCFLLCIHAFKCFLFCIIHVLCLLLYHILPVYYKRPMGHITYLRKKTQHFKAVNKFQQS